MLQNDLEKKDEAPEIELLVENSENVLRLGDVVIDKKDISVFAKKEKGAEIMLKNGARIGFDFRTNEMRNKFFDNVYGIFKDAFPKTKGKK